MHKKFNQKLFITILMFTLIITPVIALNEDVSSLVGMQAFAYSLGEIENRDALESEMLEKYSRIFSFVSQSAIDVDSQKQIIDSGNMAGNDSISSLAEEITVSCENDSQKAWALYQWMTNNIYHDTAAESDGSQSKLSSADVFESKYATAEGFSNLYVTLCRCAGVPCRKIEGLYIDSTLSYDDALTKYLDGKANHCWNEVYVNGQWKAVDVYLDCTNSCTNTVFTKSDSSDFWYSADFGSFAKSHMGMTYDESFVDDKFTYTVSMNKITASNYIGEETNITIPNGVNIVGEMANTNITEVTFPESGVTEIGNKAFNKCANLKSIVLPQSVTVIGNLAFSDCSALSEAVLPDNLKEAGTMLFSNCTSLKSITIPKTLNKINTNTFLGCSALSQVTIEDGVNLIDRLAFKNCTALESIVIPNSVNKIASSAFSGCEKLKSVVLPDNITTIAASTFEKCSSLESITIPNTITSIGNYAFKDCTALSEINVPDTLTSLGTSTFEGCTNLQSIRLKGISIIPNKAFYGCTALKTVSLGLSATEIAASAFENCTALSIFVGATEITSIRESAFSGCTSLFSIPFWRNVTLLEKCAFKNCETITNITLKLSDDKVPEEAFYGCKSLTNVTLSENIKHINSMAFYGCTALTEIDLPTGLLTIGDSAFAACTALENIGSNLPAGLTEIGSSAFTRTKVTCNGNLTIPKSIRTIKANAFSYIDEIRTLVLTSNVTTIEARAFRASNKITDVYYLGTEEQWANISIGSYNTCINNTTIHYLGSNHYHAFGKETLSNATCSEYGLVRFTCICTYAYVEKLKKRPHTEYVIKGKEATCTYRGYTDGLGCSVCGATIVKQEIIPKLDHTKGNWITDTSATCTSVGSKHIECTVCHTTMETGTIDKLPHTETTIDAVAATCTSTGLSEGKKCKVCGDIIVEPTTTPKINHTKGDFWITDTAATCTSVGSKHIECTVCHATIETGTIDKLPHTETTIDPVAATCTSTGLSEGKKCKVCGDIIVAQTTTPKVSHTKGNWITDTAATCKKEGSKHIECTICHTTLETSTIDKLPHTETTIDPVAATCTSTGLSEGKKCKVCGDIIVAQTTTPKINHTKGDSWITDTAATCTSVGSKHIECSVCHATIETGTIDKLPHTETTIDPVAATCTSTGLSEGKKCKVCGDIIVAQTTTPKVSHTKGNWITDTSATCTSVGSKHIECTVCHTTIETGTIDKLPHTETTIDPVAATCTSTGLSEGKKCKVCGDIIVAQTTTPKINHTKGNWITDTAATCTSVGSKHIECTVCHTTLEIGTIDKLPHTETTIDAVAATCTSTGLSEGKKCKVCGDIIVAQTTTPKLNHTKGDSWITDTAATCTSVGSKHIECTVCHATIETGTIDKLPHTETTIDAVAATCTSTGLSEGKKCKVCGDIIVAQTTTPKLNHTKGDSWITDTAATCTSVGSKHIECTVCHTTLETGTIDKLPHTETTIDAVAATCTSTGLSEGKKCKVCGNIIVEPTTTPKINHTKGDWITDTAATCKKEGSKHTECTICHATIETGTIDKLPHTETTIDAVAATCTSTGLSEGKKCKVCGDIIVAQTTTPEINHTKGDSWITDTAATCTSVGSKHIECTVCHTTLEIGTIDKAPHCETTMSPVAATCNSTGMTQGKKCSECGEIIEAQKVTPKLAHSMSGFSVVKRPTCTESGLERSTCQNCDHAEIRNIAATGHNYQGSVCANCGDNRSRSCSCNCHKSGFMGFIWKIICFFYKLFGTNQVCSCGAMHY